MFSQTRSTREKMYNEFNTRFEVGKQFNSKEDIRAVILEFGKKYNVVFSVKNSHPKKGQFNYICKHGGIKRETSRKADEKTATADHASTNTPVHIFVHKITNLHGRCISHIWNQHFHECTSNFLVPSDSFLGFF